MMRLLGYGSSVMVRVFSLLGLLCVVPIAAGQDEIPIGAEQAALQREFERFDDNLREAVKQARKADPDRVDVLQRAVGVAGERRIRSEMREIARLLSESEPGYGSASERQAELIVSLETVLKLLQTENQRDQLKDEKEFYEKLLKDTDALIREQKDLRAETGRNKDSEQLADEQQELAEKTEGLSKKVDEHAEKKTGDQLDEKASGEKPEDGQEADEPDGQQNPELKDGDRSDGDERPKNSNSPKSEPNDGQSPNSPPSGSPPSDTPPPGESPSSPPQDGQTPQGQTPQDPPSQQQRQQDSPPGKEELKKAAEEMQKAIEELEKEALDEASKNQDEAVAELERLRAKLREILRQLREEEEEIALTLLEARFQQMLQQQMRVNAATLRLDKTPSEERGGTFSTSTGELARDQDEIIADADKALRLLREEGSSAAFPEAVRQARESMAQVSGRLRDEDVGATTQLIESMIVEALEELVVALQKELDEKKMEQAKSQDIPPMSEADRKLVDELAELKLIRALQAQVNRMTQQFDASLEGRERTDADANFLSELARRQDRIRVITYELATGRDD